MSNPIYSGPGYGSYVAVNKKHCSVCGKEIYINSALWTYRKTKKINGVRETTFQCGWSHYNQEK